MNSAILLALLKNIVVPEIATYVHDHFNKTGELPTQEELQTQIDTISARIIMKGEAFIDEIYRDHPELKPNV